MSSQPKWKLDVSFASLLSIQHFVGDLSVCKLPYFRKSHRLCVKYSCNDSFIVSQISQNDSEGLVYSKKTSWVWSLRVDYLRRRNIVGRLYKNSTSCLILESLGGMTSRPSPHCVGTNKRCEVQLSWPIKRRHFALINNK